MPFQFPNRNSGRSELASFVDRLPCPVEFQFPNRNSGRSETASSKRSTGKCSKFQFPNRNSGRSEMPTPARRCARRSFNSPIGIRVVQRRCPGRRCRCRESRFNSPIGIRVVQSRLRTSSRSSYGMFQFPNRNSGRSELAPPYHWPSHGGVSIPQSEFGSFRDDLVIVAENPHCVSIPQSEFGSFRAHGLDRQRQVGVTVFQFPNRNSGRSEAGIAHDHEPRRSVSIPQSEFGSFRGA